MTDYEAMQDDFEEMSQQWDRQRCNEPDFNEDDFNDLPF